MKNELKPILVRAKEAAQYCGLGLSTWRVQNCAGRIPLGVRIGKTVRWRVEELQDWARAGCPDRETWMETEEYKKYQRST